MAAALALGRRGQGRAWPNPAVGCVVVRDGRVVGRGRTADGGRPHAEAVALEGVEARGATAYVTLEPCAHRGRGGPCADLLVAAGVARVVVALGDPDPRTAGQGVARLRAAGVEVVVGVREGEAREDHAGYLKRLAEGQPFVQLKLAASLDGRIATAGGESRWVTGEGARRVVHGLRARADAVMVGGGTARADDPSLDVRGFGGRPQPVRVVLSRGLDLPRGGRLALTARERPLWLVHGPGADAAPWEALGARCLGADGTLGGALRALGGAGITRALCEGGGEVAAGLLREGLADEVVTMGAGLLLGAEGRPMVGALGVARLAEAPRFRLRSLREVGGDVVATWRPR